MITQETLMSYRDLGFDERLQRLITERPKEISANDFDAFFELGEKSVDTSNLKDGAVDDASLADESVTTEKLAALAVEASKLANSSVEAEKIANLAVGSAAIANLAVISTKIADAAVLSTKIGDAQITQLKVADGAIVNAKIADATIQAAKIASLNADVINAGTIVGIAIKATSAVTGANIFLDPTNKRIAFLYNNVEKAYIYADSSGDLRLDSDNLIWLVADGSGDDIWITCGDDLYLGPDDDIIASCNEFGVVATGNATMICDQRLIAFNDDNDGSDCYWSDRGDVEMHLTNAGELYIDGSFHSGGADIAEMFESIEEFSNKKIPNGVSVVMVGDKIRPARKGDQPDGVISATATIIANGEADSGENWKGKYLTDEFGKRMKEKAEWWSITDKKEITHKGRKVKKRERRSGWVDQTKNVPKGAEIRLVDREKINPKWNPNKKYVSRKDRPEWNIVGFLGRVRVRKDQPINDNWKKMKDISENVAEYFIGLPQL